MSDKILWLLIKHIECCLISHKGCTPIYMPIRTVDNIIWLQFGSSVAKHGASSTICTSLKKQQTAKLRGFNEEQNGTVRWSVKQRQVAKAVKHYSRKSGHCFANFIIQLTLFLHVIYCSVFCLVAFFILSTIGLSLFFNAFQHWALLPSLRVSLLLGVFSFLNFYHICYYSFVGIKATTKLDPCGWPQRRCFVVTNIWLKMQTYSEKLYRLIFHSLYDSSTLS